MIDLDTIEKKENYDIPEGYFDDFSDRMVLAVKKERNKKRTLITSAIAAVAVAILAVTVFFNYKAPEKTPEIVSNNIEDIATDEELEYLATEYYSEELAMMDYYNSLEY